MGSSAFSTGGSGPFPSQPPGSYPAQYVPQPPQTPSVSSAGPSTGAGGNGSAGVHTEQLRQFWQTQMSEVQAVGTDPAEFKNHQLPLARIKKVCCPHTLLGLSGCYTPNMQTKSNRLVQVLRVACTRCEQTCLLSRLGFTYE